jgi:nitrite reductase/ring-hydroxylating ferredoxin subunit
MTLPATPGDGWTRVASLAELVACGRLRVESDGLDILLVKDGGAVRACGNVCAHQHVPLLHTGMIEGSRVTCPMHGWTYDLHTGLSGGGEGRIPVYAVALRGDDILVRTP